MHTFFVVHSHKVLQRPALQSALLGAQGRVERVHFDMHCTMCTHWARCSWCLAGYSALYQLHKRNYSAEHQGSAAAAVKCIVHFSAFFFFSSSSTSHSSIPLAQKKTSLQSISIPLIPFANTSLYFASSLSFLLIFAFHLFHVQRINIPFLFVLLVSLAMQTYPYSWWCKKENFECRWFWFVQKTR